MVGLGNPGRRYAATLHNAGFLAVDRIAKEVGARWRESGDAALADCDFEGRPAVLVKPLTFMNLSGLAVAPLFRKRADEPYDLVVVHDDLDLPAGAVRLKRGGGTGGHKGLKSLVAELGTADFLRIRIGVGRPPSGVDSVDYVLAPANFAEKALFDEVVAAAAVAASDIARLGFDKAMTRWNARARTLRENDPPENILLAPGEKSGGSNIRKEATPHDDSEEV